MKIIDNKKDYYDYLMGIYGIDNKIVYDRRDSMTFDCIKKTNMFSDNVSQIRVKIGNLVYYIVKNQETGKWECPDEITTYDGRYYDTIPNPVRLNNEELKREFTLWRSDKTGADIPIMIKYDHSVFPNPILATFPVVPKFIPATTVWEEVYNFISSKYDTPITDTRTEKQKIESAGFDSKTSFRNM